MSSADREPKPNGNSRAPAHEEHRLELTRRTDDMAEWQCRRCGRHVRLDFATRRFSVLAKGDQLINHGSASLGDRVEIRGGVRAHRDDDTVH